jgi:septal ring factor EnvC (AmiA/AmiB activator)
MQQLATLVGAPCETFATTCTTGQSTLSYIGCYTLTLFAGTSHCHMQQTCYYNTTLQLRAELAAAHRELEAARREAAAAVTKADVSQQRARHLEAESATVVRHCSQEDRRLSQWSDELSALQSRLTERARDLEQVRVAVLFACVTVA